MPRVLIVDREPGRRAALCRMVRGMGYDVHVAADGAGALLDLHRQPGRAHLIFVDPESSRMRVEELADSARRLDPSVHVVVLLAAEPPHDRPALPVLLTPVSFGPLYDLLVKRLGPPAPSPRAPASDGSRLREPEPSG